MRVLRRYAMLALLGALFGAPALAQPAGQRPVVVELYTSQGCWECRRANRLMGLLSREDGLIALTFAVDYWDYLGWTDTLAQREFTRRQRAYALALHGSRATPQLVVDGARQMSARDWDAARSAIDQTRAAPRPAGAATIVLEHQAGRTVRVSVAPGASPVEADVWLVNYDPGPILVLVYGGINSGRTVSHYNVVRSIERIGAWSGAALTIDQQRCWPECAVLVQTPNGGPILGAATAPPRRQNGQR